MKLTITFIISFFLLFTSYISEAQILTGNKASDLIPGAEMIRYSNNPNTPDYVKLLPGHEESLEKMGSWIKSVFKTGDTHTFVLIGDETDASGDRHLRYQQCFMGIPIREAIFILHTRDEKIYAMNGNIYPETPCATTSLMNEAAARQLSLQFVGASRYMWEEEGEEARLKTETGNPGATYFPAGKLVIVRNEVSGEFRACWKFDIYALRPLSRQEIYIDGQTGKVILNLNRIHTDDVPATVVTKYSGTQTMTTDSTGPGNYRLRQSGRGNGIQTFDMNQGTNYGSAVDFTDADNYWNNVNAQQDEVGGDAHWGTEKTYDYFWLEHSRNSIDDNGFALISYVHYDQNYANAFWDGQRMTYGDGDGSYSAFTALDICAHEITHGLTTFTANLDYVDESGALSEGFSDIFGTCVEFYGKPALANWSCGENIGITLRSLSNPNATQNPDTYLGDYWDPGQEVHQNSTICSHWFYLLSQGGSGTNDNNDVFSVSGQGIDKAGDIAFRTLTVYLINTSGFDDARFYSIVAASDLFGGCSPEVEATTNAWYAVGIGNVYVPNVVPDFDADVTSLCSAPADVDFSNMTVNANSYFWDFGDGATSTSTNPVHTYANPGDYNVKLVAYGGSCGTDSITKNAFISIQPTNTASVSMPASGTGRAQDCCSGTLYDSGGEGTYGNNVTSTITIAPTGAMNVVLNFVSFAMEDGYDYLFVYDGPSTASPLIGQYDGFTLPNGGTITSSGGSITLRQYTDPGVVENGFEINWQCNYPNAAPVTAFTANVNETCTGEVQFTDQSTNGPQSWLWDFGDGNTSTQQNPLHHYAADGLFSVKLKTTNSFGSDSLTQSNYIQVDMPDAPAVFPATICDSSSAVLNASGSGQIDWYDAQVAGTLLFSGNSFTTPPLYSSTTYYAEDVIQGSIQSGGKADNSGGGGYTASGERYLVFDAYTDLILLSVDIYGNSSNPPGTRDIELRNSSGLMLATTTANIAAGLNTVNLNFTVPAGNDHRLIISNVSNIFRNNSGVTYPYLTTGLISVKNSDAGTGYYYAFYNWQVREPDCVSARVPVTATVIDCIGMDEIQGISGISMGPNPCNDQITLNFRTTQAATLTVEIRDLTGRTILKESISTNQGENRWTADTRKLAEGSYLISLDDGNSARIFRFVKI